MPHEVLICLTAGNTWFCHLLRQLFNTAFDRCLVMYQCPFWGGWWVVQPSSEGVKKIPAEVFLKRQTAIECWGYQNNLDSGLSTLRMYRGVKSNWWEIFKNFLLMKIYLSSDAEGNKARVFFSRFLGFELGAEVLKYSNVMGTAGWDTSFTLPNGFHQFLSEHPHFYVTRNPVV